MRIDSPQATADAKCGTTASVCVMGSDAIMNGNLVLKVYAKIYQPPAAPPNPQNGPPAGTDWTAPQPNGEWCLGLLDGASGATPPGPYTQNTIWAWAEYLDRNGELRYSATVQSFYASCIDGNPSCCSSSSSSSSGANSYSSGSSSYSSSSSSSSS